MSKRARVLIDCKDAKGLVYLTSKVFYDRGLNIDNNREFVDKETDRFFMRTVVSGDFSSEELERALIDVVPKDAIVQIIEPKKKNIVIMATKESHCLGDILIRWSSNELEANIVAVIANHNDLRELTSRFDIPFIHISADNLTREMHEELVKKELDKLEFDHIVLAKYMRILSSNFVSSYSKKIINIHHSFLPAFIGANPYKQAYERGVKIIGATAHFVNNDLDEGPIIYQNITPVDHTMSWEDMRNIGRDVEKNVLTNALKLVFNDKIFVHGNKTIILQCLKD